jgi:undecaprenyl-diphosphatase
VFVVGARAARSGRVGSLEQRAFRVVNRLPREAFVPVWLVMQLGSLGGVLLLGAAATSSGRPSLGRRLAVAGSLTWAGAKVVKYSVRRDRPAAVMDAARILGRAPSGLGYPSGHAAVAATLATVAMPELEPSWRVATWTTALAVGPARAYVGAHLPLDVVGGVAFGIAAGTVFRLLTSAIRPRPG